jgi:hypothetical protein
MPAAFAVQATFATPVSGSLAAMPAYRGRVVVVRVLDLKLEPELRGGGRCPLHGGLEEGVALRVVDVQQDLLARQADAAGHDRTAAAGRAVAGGRGGAGARGGALRARRQRRSGDQDRCRDLGVPPP